jgi:hypothetical protein
MVSKIAIGLAAAAIAMVGVTSGTLAQQPPVQPRPQEPVQPRPQEPVQPQNRATQDQQNNLPRNARDQANPRERGGRGGNINLNIRGFGGEGMRGREAFGGFREGRGERTKVHVHLHGGAQPPGFAERQTRIVEHRHIGVPSVPRGEKVVRITKSYGRSCR